MQSNYTCLRCLTRQSCHAVRRPLRLHGLNKLPTGFAATRFKQHHPDSKALFHTAPARPRPAARAERLFEDTAYLPRSDEDSEAAANSHPILDQDNLFHPFSTSPIPAIRRRAAFMKHHAYCPHPSHHQTRVATSPYDSESRKVGHHTTLPPAHVQFECPDCGIPVYCSEGHWADDYEHHLEVCETLRQINEDDHDLRSERFFSEFEYPGPQIEEALINLKNWDTLLYTRQFRAINDLRSLRQATKLLTYPITIGSILHELSPYGIRKGERLTTEGLKSLSALRYTLHPPKDGAGPGFKRLRPQSPPVRLFILGARAESSLPRDAWDQLWHLFPRAKLHLLFIGPEAFSPPSSLSPPPRTPSNPWGAAIEAQFSFGMKISTMAAYFHDIHRTGYFAPYDPYFDCFVLFHPGLGHPASQHEWAETLPCLLETKVPVICTGFTEWDMQRDREWVEETCKGEYDLLMEPGENRFASLRWDLNDLDPQGDLSAGNWGVWAFRGKRYEAQTREG